MAESPPPEHGPATPPAPAPPDAGQQPVALAARRFDWTTVLGWIVLIGAVVLPPHGAGVPACPSKFITGIPCPGCGLTRSVGCIAHGEWEWSWHYHPFGGAALLIFAWLAFFPLLPARWREAVRSRFRPYRRGLRIMAAIGIALFVLFGAVRAVRFVMGDRTILAGPPGAAAHPP